MGLRRLLISRLMVKPFHGDVSCIWSCPIYHTTTYSKYTPELFQYINVTLLFFQWLSPRLPFQTKTVRLFHVLTGCAFHWVQGPLKRHVWVLSTHSYCYWHVNRARNVLRCWTEHHQESQNSLQSCYRTTNATLNVFPCQLVWVYAWSGFCMFTAEDPSLRFFATMHVKNQVLGNVFGGNFLNPSDRISHCIHIVRMSCSQLPAWSRIFCFLVEVVYWPCSLKFVYPTINLAFLGIIVKLTFVQNFVCTVLNVFVSK